jgi:hypothetical protein
LSRKSLTRMDYLMEHTTEHPAENPTEDLVEYPAEDLIEYPVEYPVEYAMEDLTENLTVQDKYAPSAGWDTFECYVTMNPTGGADWGRPAIVRRGRLRNARIVIFVVGLSTTTICAGGLSGGNFLSRC